MKEFKIGDRVKIRSWESMAEEFGMDEYGDISPSESYYYFTAEMRRLCGREATVAEISRDSVRLKNWSENSGVYSNWKFENFMLEPALPRICYLLGGEDTPLEIGEEFEVEGKCSKYYISEEGVMLITEYVSKSLSGLYTALNHPEKIIRKPKIEFTDDEKAFMRLLMAGAGFKYIARDFDNDLFAYIDKPVKDSGVFINTGGDDEKDFCGIQNFLLPQITFVNSPIRMEEYL